nr:hypothetical protein HKBLJLKJ_00049 [Porcine reproductive and respiratory syndrome virus]
MDRRTLTHVGKQVFPHKAKDSGQDKTLGGQVIFREVSQCGIFTSVLRQLFRAIWPGVEVIKDRCWNSRHIQLKPGRHGRGQDGTPISYRGGIRRETSSGVHWAPSVTRGLVRYVPKPCVLQNPLHTFRVAPDRVQFVRKADFRSIAAPNVAGLYYLCTKCNFLFGGLGLKIPKRAIDPSISWPMMGDQLRRCISARD